MSVISRVILVASVLPATAAASDAEATFWLAGGYHAEHTRESGRREYRVMLGLSLPFDAWLAGSASARLAQGPHATGDSNAQDSAAQDSAAQDSAAQDSAAQDSAAEVEEKAEPASTAERARTASEPDEARSSERDALAAALKPVLRPTLVRETLDRALKANGFKGSDAHLQAMASRARWSAVLPEMRLRAARSTDESLRLAPTVGDPYRYTRDGGTGVTLEARLGWHLSRLWFSASELGVERLRQTRVQRRAALERQVLKVLFTWQRAYLASRDPGAFEEQRNEAALDAFEAELTLNALTGGWFEERRVLAANATEGNR